MASLLVLTLLTWPVEAPAGELTLTWVDRSGDELGFSVERSTGTSGVSTEIAVTGPGVTVYTDVGLADGTTYCYRVRAFNASAYSDYSNMACGVSAPVAGTLTLGLALNKESYTTGETFSATLTEGNSGDAPISVDKYFGVLLPASASALVPCPGGDGIVFFSAGGEVLTCLSSPATFEPYEQNVALPAGLLVTTPRFFDFVWPPAASGPYVFFIAYTRTGTLEVIASGTSSASFTP